ncbi:MAG: electron transport complex subunit RsxE, partial [Acidaminococcaceae bacterium]|nr:electron transport complex subunit RsxE [Acidaminococcaceae bacterium]
MLNTIMKGVFSNNPLFVQLLGVCAALATTSSLVNALGMGVAFTLVLIGSNVVVSCIKSLIPPQIRIPSYIVVIASLVTIVEFLMHAYTPEVYVSLGIFIPLIVVNCIILGRAESFASKNSVLDSFCDGLGNGLGFTVALLAIAFFRELLGTGKVFDYAVIGAYYEPILI